MVNICDYKIHIIVIICCVVFCWTIFTCKLHRIKMHHAPKHDMWFVTWWSWTIITCCDGHNVTIIIAIIVIKVKEVEFFNKKIKLVV
jgi:hypothetical protein